MSKRNQACITLDLEPDHAGHAPESYRGWSETKITQLLGTLKKHRVKLTIFVVGKSIQKQKKVIKLFQKSGAEFHLHSNSHNPKEPDSEREILGGMEEFKKFFDHYPKGYRAPEGRISRNGLLFLKQKKFKFDASIFPSFWPNPAYFTYGNKPFYPFGDTKFLEVPFTTVTPLKLPLSLSWIKLVGWKSYKYFLRFPLPNVLVVNFHLHDLWHLPAYKELPLFWKMVYSRHESQGLEILDKLLETIVYKGYTFSTFNELVRRSRFQ